MRQEEEKCFLIFWLTEMTLVVKNVAYLLSFFFIVVINDVSSESSTCLAVYKHGGAPAVFRSPNCPRWNLQNHGSSSVASRCHTAVIQGRRKYQEDRLLCALDLCIHFPGTNGPKDVVVGIAAVFDGHNGAEASEMASTLFLDYFALHTDFLLFEYSLPLDILKEALLRAIHDIDATFTEEASNRKLDSGSTATIALIADGHLMVANIGDSNALLCSERFETPQEAKATLVKSYREQRCNRGSSPSRFSDFKLENIKGLVRLIAKGLTKEHHPNREDEKVRVEASGGYVTEWAGVSRVNGQLAVSRSIGDLPYKRYGVISTPEVREWQPLLTNDRYLVVSSDGIFEKLELQQVCDLLWEVNNQTTSGAGVPLAYCLINTAFDKGSMDNMAVVVVPLRPDMDSKSKSQSREKSMRENTDGHVSLSGISQQIPSSGHEESILF